MARAGGYFGGTARPGRPVRHHTPSRGSTRHIAHGVLSSPHVQHVVRHYAPTRSSGRIARQVLGSRGVQRVTRQGVRIVQQRRLPVQIATPRVSPVAPQARLAQQTLSSPWVHFPAMVADTQQRLRAMPPPAIPHVPNVFHTKIGPVNFKPYQAHAARFVEQAVAKVPGRARPPRFPQLARYNRAQRAYIAGRTQQYAQQAARDRGYGSVRAATRQGVSVGGQIGRYGEPQARQAVQTYSRVFQPQQARQSVRRGQPLDFRLRRAGDYGPSPAASILSGGIHPVSGMTLANVASAVNKGFVAPSVKGTLDLAANAPGAIYNTAAATFEALHGDTARAKRLIHQFVNHDPVALLLQGRIKEAGQATAQNPVAATLEVLGVKAGVGRTAGRVQRAAGVSREMKPAVLEGTQIVQRRPYSKDAITRKRQIAVDRGRLAVSRGFAEQAAKAAATGALDQAKGFTAKARAWSPHHVSDFQVHRRIDERVHANEMVRRAMRGLAMRRAQKHVTSRRKGGAVMSLLAQGIVHPHHGDIQAYLGELDARFHSGQLTKAQALANRSTAQEIRGAVGSKHLNLPQLHARAKAFAVEQAAVEAHLVRSGLLDAAQAEKARLIPYAVRRMGASHNGERIIGPDGRFLSSRAIKQHMLHNGVNPDHVAYLSQAPNARGARNFYMNTLQRHVIPDLRRTGEATRNGTFDTHPNTFVEQAAREANLLAADHGFKGLIGEFATRHDAGHPDAGAVRQFGTKRSAQLWIDDQHAQGARGLRAVRMNPFLGKQKDLEHVIEAVNSNREVPASLLDQVHAAVDHSADGPGPWAVIHDTAAHRLQQHLSLQQPIPGLRGMQKINQAFRNAVLPLSTKWITGNVVEAGFRTALAGAGPLSYLTGRAAFKRLDQLHAEGKITEGQMLEARARTVGGGHFAMAEQTSVHRGADQFEHSVLRPVAHALGAVARAPGPRNVGHLWQGYTHFVFSKNGAMERHFQTALAGKYLRDMKPSGRELALSRKAVEQAAQGLTNTNEQVAMGRFIDRAYGKYGKFNPTERALIAYYTPFIAWSLNAVKFVFSVLPKDHPVATGLLVAAQNASEPWLKDHGLNLWIKNAAPGWLQGSIPVANGGKVRAGRYLPFGFFGDLAQNTAGTLMPQYASAFMALNGLDWKGQSLAGPFGADPDQGTKFGAALNAFLGGTVPILGQVEQVATKKGPLGQRLQRQFNPFYPVQPTASGSAGGPHDQAIDKALGGGAGVQGQFDQQIDKALTPGGAEGMGRRLAGYTAPAVRRPSKAYVRQFLRSPAGGDYRVKNGFLVPRSGAKPGGKPPVSALQARRVAQGLFKNPLFAHPGRAAIRNTKAGRDQVAWLARNTLVSAAVKGHAVPIRNGQFVLPKTLPTGRPTVRLAGTPSVTLRRFAQYGVKDSSGKVLIPANHARRLVGHLSALGYGHGQIVRHLAAGAKLKALGPPAQLVLAAKVLKGVKNVAAAVPQNKSHYSPAEISKMAQSHGAPKWLADALGRTSIPESGGNPLAKSGSAGGGSWGLLQINQAAHTELNKQKLWNPDYNVRAALYVMSKQGSGAWSGSGTWHDRPVAAGQFKFPMPEQQKQAVKLTPRQHQAVKVVERAARNWPTSSGVRSATSSKVPAAFRKLVGPVPVYGKPVKGGLSVKDLPPHLRKLLKRYGAQPAAMPGVPSNTSGISPSTGVTGVSPQPTSQSASAAKASALSGLPAADLQALAALVGPQQGPVLSTPLTAPAFSAGAVFPSGYTAGQVSLADILTRITGRPRV